MRFEIVTLLAVTASTASAAGSYRQPHQVKRDLALAIRQTAAPEATCLSALLSAYGSVPTPPPELVSFYATHTPTDACDTGSIPATLSPVYQTYESSIFSWFTAHSSAIYSALSQCPAYTSNIAQSPVCTSALPGAGGAGSGPAATTTAAGSGATGAGSGSGSGSSGSTATKNAGPKETGFVAAAVAAAGFIGAIAAL